MKVINTCGFESEEVNGSRYHFYGNLQEVYFMNEPFAFPPGSVLLATLFNHVLPLRNFILVILLIYPAGVQAHVCNLQERAWYNIRLGAAMVMIS